MGRIAVVVTVRNEQDTISSLLTALKSQTLKPSEVIITDGGSNDETLHILKEFSKSWSALRIYALTGNRSHGRNFGVVKSSSPFVAFTDAGCVPHDDWLENLTNGFANPSTDVISGYYRGIGKSSFEKSLIPYCLVMPDKSTTSEFFPSTRSMAIRRSKFIEAGGFNEMIDPGEDFELAHRLKKMGTKFVFAPDALVDWRPRKNISQAAWMFLMFAYSDIKSLILRPKVKLLIIRYLSFTYLFFLGRFWPFIHSLLPLSVVAYLLWAVFKNFRYVRQLSAIFWLPVLQLTSDIMVLLGTTMGFLEVISSPRKK